MRLAGLNDVPVENGDKRDGRGCPEKAALADAGKQLSPIRPIAPVSAAFPAASGKV